MLKLRVILGDAAWLDAARARAWGWVLAAVMALAVIGYLASLRGAIDPWGKPVGTDFVSFWTASAQMRAGPVAGIYDPLAHHRAEMLLFAEARPDFYGFFYPPVFALVCLPWAYLPYGIALAAWLLVGFVPLVLILRRMLPQRWAWLPILAYPGWVVNAGHGQNGFLSAALMGAFMLSEGAPGWGGAALGALAFKPQLMVPVPVALLAAGRWRAWLGCAAAVLGLAGLSVLVLGFGSWRAFWISSDYARQVLEAGLVDPAKMVSVFAALRLLHAPLWLAYGGQAAAAVAVFAVLARVMARVMARRPAVMAQGAVLAAASGLCTPFLLDYDLTLLALPMAFVMREALRTGWWRWEKPVLLAAYALPLLARPVAMATGLGLAPFVVAALFWVVARRVQAGVE